MRCKTCDYPLWQIRDRKCPECGSAFVPSDFEFTLNSVRFCCPHCEQAYYGTGEKGHLSPRSFACVKCANLIDMDQMVLLPAEGVKDEQTEPARQPWLERGKRRKFIGAWFATVGHALVKPGRLMAATPPSQGAADATWFMVFTQLVIAIVAFAPMLVLMGVISVAGASGRGGMGGTMMVAGPFGIMAIGLLAVWLLGMLMTCLCAHGILRVTGGCAFGIGRTWQAICYSSGANVTTCVPCLGFYVGWIWWLVSACVAVKEAQKVHGGRATLAVLTFPVVGIATFVGLYAWFVVAMVGASGALSAANSSVYTLGVDEPRISSIGAAMLTGSASLRHAGELLVDDRVQPNDFVGIAPSAPYSTSSGRGARLDAIKVGGNALSRFEMDDRDTKSRAVEREIAGMPKGAVAYRIGDTVFTHLGMDLRDPKIQNSTLWIVIGSAENPRAGRYGGATGITVSCANGTTRSFAERRLPGELTTQNRLRKQFGLGPIPAPKFVNQGVPAQPAADDWGGLDPPTHPAPDDADGGGTPGGP